MQWLDFKQEFKTTDITEGSKWKLSESIFTSFLMKRGRIVALQAHFERLNDHLFKIYNVKLTESFKSKILNLLKDNAHFFEDIKVRIEFFRKDLKLWPEVIDDLSCFIDLSEFHLSDSVVFIQHDLIPFIDNSLSNIKTAQYMQASIIKKNRAEIDFIYCKQNEVLEGSTSGLVLSIEDKLFTSNSSSILCSITIDELMRRKKIEITKKKLTIEDLKNAQEIILLNSVRGVIAVGKWGEKSLHHYLGVNSNTSKMKEIYADLFVEL